MRRDEYTGREMSELHDGAGEKDERGKAKVEVAGSC